MTVKEAQHELERAGRELEKVVAQLVETPTEAGRWPAGLKLALDALQRTRDECPAARNDESFTAMLKTIHTRVTQVELLLESAALFYFGVLAIGAHEGAGYTYEGALQQSAFGGRMQLEA